jgi:hypothetical protein
VGPIPLFMSASLAVIVFPHSAARHRCSRAAPRLASRMRCRPAGGGGRAAGYDEREGARVSARGAAGEAELCWSVEAPVSRSGARPAHLSES